MLYVRIYGKRDNDPLYWALFHPASLRLFLGPYVFNYQDLFLADCPFAIGRFLPRGMFTRIALQLMFDGAGKPDFPEHWVSWCRDRIKPFGYQPKANGHLSQVHGFSTSEDQPHLKP